MRGDIKHIVDQCLSSGDTLKDLAEQRVTITRRDTKLNMPAPHEVGSAGLLTLQPGTYHISMRLRKKGDESYTETLVTKSI